MTLQSLRERVAGATGPDRELDALICAAFRIPSALVATQPWAVNWQGRYVAKDGRVYLEHSDGRLGAHWAPEPVTASVDAALALIERVLPGAQVVLMLVPNRAQAWVGNDDGGEIITAPTPALALISALLAAVEMGDR